MVVVSHSQDDRAASENDQSVSDLDQTLADRDQTASDRDQRSANDDQAAADVDLAAGSDPRTHERTMSQRKQTSHDRADAAHSRDDASGERLRGAELRDHSAGLRDRAAAHRGRRHEGEAPAPSQDDDILIRAERDRAIAAADRLRAAEDRARAAADREESAREREEAFLAKAEARQSLLAAATDELTGAYTRRFGLESLNHEIERARRTQDTLTLAFIDVNGLKEVNDTRGHKEGDQLLHRVAATLRAHVRPYDVIVRYGGDEFLCALPHLGQAGARDRMEKIAAVLAAADPQHSISFGLSDYQPPDGLDELIGRADADLLAARRSARRGD